MFFMGASQTILNGLRSNLSQIDKRIDNMTFYELPFCDVEDFDYQNIAQMIEKDKAEIIWIALGAPKQEIFMNRLQPHLRKGVMIAVRLYYIMSGKGNIKKNHQQRFLLGLFFDRGVG